MCCSSGVQDGDYCPAQGYLYTSTVDLLATDPRSLAFCWIVFSVCFILPNTIILPSYIAIIFLYR